MSVKSCVLAIVLLVSACSSAPTVPSADDCIGCATKDSVKLNLAVPPAVNLTPYESIKFTESGGVVSFSSADYVRLETLLTELESRIAILQSMLFSYQNFYEKKDEPVDRKEIPRDSQ